MESTFRYQGHEYVLNSRKDETGYYKCIHHFIFKCKARAIIRGTQATVKGLHVCKEHISTESQKADIDKLIISYSLNETLMPNQIYQKIVSHVESLENYVGVILPSKKVITNKIYSIRKSYECKLEDMIVGQASLAIDGSKFMRRAWRGDILGKDHTIAIWASEESLSVFRQRGQCFIDGTFKCVPHGFSQSVIIMGLDKTTNLYVPCVYSLLSGKFEHLYLHLIQEIISMLDWCWDPEIIVVDYEYALIKALKSQFPGTRILGCFFHFKQAIVRKMMKLGIRQDVAKIYSCKFDFLTVIDRNLVNLGIDYLLEKYSTECEKWSEFIEYFKKTFLVKYSPTLWNIEEEISNQN